MGTETGPKRLRRGRQVYCEEQVLVGEGLLDVTEVDTLTNDTSSELGPPNGRPRITQSFIDNERRRKQAQWDEEQKRLGGEFNICRDKPPPFHANLSPNSSESETDFTTTEEIEKEEDQHRTPVANTDNQTPRARAGKTPVHSTPVVANSNTITRLTSRMVNLSAVVAIDSSGVHGRQSSESRSVDLDADVDLGEVQNRVFPRSLTFTRHQNDGSNANDGSKTNGTYTIRRNDETQVMNRHQEGDDEAQMNSGTFTVQRNLTITKVTTVVTQQSQLPAAVAPQEELDDAVDSSVQGGTFLVPRTSIFEMLPRLPHAQDNGSADVHAVENRSKTAERPMHLSGTGEQPEEQTFTVVRQDARPEPVETPTDEPTTVGGQEDRTITAERPESPEDVTMASVGSPQSAASRGTKRTSVVAANASSILLADLGVSAQESPGAALFRAKPAKKPLLKTPVRTSSGSNSSIAFEGTPVAPTANDSVSSKESYVEATSPEKTPGREKLLRESIANRQSTKFALPQRIQGVVNRLYTPKTTPHSQCTREHAIRSPARLQKPATTPVTSSTPSRSQPVSGQSSSRSQPISGPSSDSRSDTSNIPRPTAASPLSHPRRPLQMRPTPMVASPAPRDMPSSSMMLSDNIERSHAVVRLRGRRANIRPVKLFPDDHQEEEELMEQTEGAEQSVRTEATNQLKRKSSTPKQKKKSKTPDNNQKRPASLHGESLLNEETENIRPPADRLAPRIIFETDDEDELNMRTGRMSILDNADVNNTHTTIRGQANETAASRPSEASRRGLFVSPLRPQNDDDTLTPIRKKTRARFVDDDLFTVDTPGVHARLSAASATRDNGAPSFSDSEDEEDEFQENSQADTTADSDMDVTILATGAAPTRRQSVMVLMPRKVLPPSPNKDGLRRSQRNRIKPVRTWLGEQPVYAQSPGGSQVLTGVTGVEVRDKIFIKARTAEQKAAFERRKKTEKQRKIAREKKKERRRMVEEEEDSDEE